MHDQCSKQFATNPKYLNSLSVNTLKRKLKNAILLATTNIVRRRRCGISVISLPQYKCEDSFTYVAHKNWFAD